MAKTLIEKQARFPANAFRARTELFERTVLNLTNALLADAEQMPDLTKAANWVMSTSGEGQVGNLPYGGF